MTSIRINFRIVSSFFSLALIVSSAQALSLLDAYEAALENDPLFRAAVYENEAGLQAEKIGLSGLLPNLSITHSDSENTGTRKLFGQPRTPLNFHSQVSSLALRQPILNMEAVASYRQGKAQANSSRARFTGQSQELVIRLSEAYFGALLAQHQVRLAQSQIDSLAELKRANEQMLLKGEGTTTDVLETQSRHALAEARLIEAKDELDVAQLRLESIIGLEITQLHHLSDVFQAEMVHLPDFDDWRVLALDRNAELVTQRHALLSSKEEIRKSYAGHTPRVDLVASISRNKSASFVTANQNVELASIGVEVNVPLYAGGRVMATTDQARANFARAEAEMDAAIDNVLVELRRQYQLVLSSVKRIRSLELAVKSAKLLVNATEKSIRGGIRINLDLLDAQQQLFNSQLDLAEAKYNFLLAYLRLNFTAGTLVLDDLQRIAAYFTPESPLSK
ncbi:outer membrane protein, protease secretion system [Nitrosomonas sp. Nm51]|uniref:TolC family outer membrane protein n=1 Tax=Nitrosomonas sp. Nm51 TaxID=133720 RepID=UPI0008C2EBBA|nr:TolC family outer membrane protein [Nitrosomonas sp. Nm51]SER26427.1 outer membrane protein, protease secretion system [Nitrosomonas sp. Nm51]